MKKPGLDDILYFLEHNHCPEMFWELKETFAGNILYNESILNKILTKICKEEGIENPYTNDDYGKDFVRMDENTFALMIKFPKPLRSPLCYYSILFWERGCDKLAYYTLEMSEGNPVIGEWEQNGQHYNYGAIKEFEEGTFPQEVFAICFEIFKGKITPVAGHRKGKGVEFY